MTSRAAGITLALLLAAPACAIAADAEPGAEVAAAAGERNGREIYQRFRDGLADPSCEADASKRWKAHFAHAPKQMASGSDDVLPLFGYVVDQLRASHLPTEYALIPFVESGYKPGARSPQGPAGLWQMIAVTARNHKVPIRAGYDGRLSPVDSTTAAVRYLKTLHGMFAGDWRLAVMAYNAGEYRILGALRRSGQTARNAKPETLPGLSPITHAYVRKLHALSCLLEQAEDRDDWLRALDRPVPRLDAVALPASVDNLTVWARRNGQDPDRLQRLNPAFVNGRIARAGGQAARLLAVASATTPTSSSPLAAGAVDVEGAAVSSADIASTNGTAPAAQPAKTADVPVAETSSAATARRHTVVRGDSPWKIAARYDIGVAELLERNGLPIDAVLRPGRTLLIDPVVATAEAVPGKSASP